MLTQTLRRILTLSPKGRTTLQFVRLLESAAIRASRAEVYASLDEMRRKGLVFIDRGGYWHLGRQHSGTSVSEEAMPTVSGETRTDAPLLSVNLRRQPESDPAESADEVESAQNDAAPPVKKLLSYYQSTQTADLRGPISYALSDHENRFQLFRAPRRWWNPAATLMIELESLPPTFRFALSKRRGEPVVIGYPLEIISRDGVTEAVPVGLIGATIIRSGFSIEVTPQASGMILNPDWLIKTANGWKGGVGGLAERFGGATNVDLEEFCEILSDCMELRQSGRLEPNSLTGTIDPETVGICNAAAILLPADNALNRHTGADLGRLAEMSEAELEGTALWRVLRENSAPDIPGLVANPVPLTPNQFEAAQLAAISAVSAITAPPGTGKSHIIVSLIASAIAQSKSVLLVSTNEQAIDPIENRLAELATDSRLLLRADGKTGERAKGFIEVMSELVGDRTRPNADVIGADLQTLRAKAEERAAVCIDYLQARRLHCSLSQHVERRAAILARLGEKQVGAGRMISFSRGRREREGQSLPEVLEPGATLEEIEAVIERDRTFLAGIETRDVDPVTLGEEVLAIAARVFPQLAANALAIDPVDRQQIHAEQERYRSPELIEIEEVPERIARVVTGCQPVWAVNPRSASARIPLVPGLFDFVIFVDGNFCDIATALPLMARAKQAVIFGDPDQLDAVPRLEPIQERLLLDDSELSLQSMKGYLQSSSSLFGYCSARPGTRSAILRDQFRSAPAIVEYLNDGFYHGRLRPCRDVSGLKLSGAAAPGISWTDVRGRALPDRYGQPRNHDEAEALAAHLEFLIMQSKFDGSIGVVSPFRAQVSIIRRLADKKIPRELQESAGLEIALTSRFQGQAKDIMLFSPVAAPGIAESAKALLMDDTRHFSTSIGRARTLAHVFGDMGYAQRSGIRPLADLAKAAAVKRGAENPEGGFVSNWQRRVDEALRARGLSPSPQYPVGGHYLDFAIFGEGGIKLDLEVDGRQWLADPDNGRKFENVWWDHQLKNQGWRVRRFWVHELEHDMEKCLDQVERDLAG